mmetsp:Transcript_99/g.312  ORF Transcript_99/g.312 Transcript_99/m.312 type:complete len:370 (+) Transcript_99:664-1773(+)
MAHLDRSRSPACWRRWAATHAMASSYVWGKARATWAPAAHAAGNSNVKWKVLVVGCAARGLRGSRDVVSTRTLAVRCGAPLANSTAARKERTAPISTGRKNAMSLMATNSGVEPPKRRAAVQASSKALRSSQPPNTLPWMLRSVGKVTTVLSMAVLATYTGGSTPSWGSSRGGATLPRWRVGGGRGPLPAAVRARRSAKRRWTSPSSSGVGGDLSRVVSFSALRVTRASAAAVWRAFSCGDSGTTGGTATALSSASRATKVKSALTIGATSARPTWAALRSASAVSGGTGTEGGWPAATRIASLASRSPGRPDSVTAIAMEERPTHVTQPRSIRSLSVGMGLTRSMRSRDAVTSVIGSALGSPGSSQWV